MKPASAGATAPSTSILGMSRKPQTCTVSGQSGTVGIGNGELDTTFLISHHASLEDAPDMYKHWHDDQNEYTKIVLKTDAAAIPDRAARTTKPCPPRWWTPRCTSCGRARSPMGRSPPSPRVIPR